MNRKRKSTKRRFVNGPVKWLLGRQLISGLKWIAVYAFYGEKIHPRDWMRNEVIDFSGKEKIKHDQDGKECFWFDYMADSGDDDCAVYNIALLCMSDLWLDNGDVRNGDPVHFTDGQCKLPRGEFLFVGGDTAYHIADYSTLVERFQKPFNWAFQDLSKRFAGMEKKTIFAIPGNHDYYDALDGFNRQFCQPADDDCGQLALDGFERKQQASYVAIKLPFDWMFWGLDAQGGEMDFRQKRFFQSTCKNIKGEVETPKKLIVATPEPTTKFGQWIKDGEAIIHSFSELSLPANFRYADQGRLDDKFCRLDISGDIHHYARYWGEGAGKGPRQNNYASVISGGGGAFLHASHTDVGEITANQIYPSRRDSHNIMIKQLFNPVNIWQGGYVWLAGAVISLVLYFAATIPDSTWSIFSAVKEVTFIDNASRPCPTAEFCYETVLQRIQGALAIENLDAIQYDPHFLDFIFSLGLLLLLVSSILRLQDNKFEIIRASARKWKRYKTRFLGIFSAVVFLKFLVIKWMSGYPAYPAAASMLSLLYIVDAIIILVYSRFLADLMIARSKYLNVAPDEEQVLSWQDENIPVWMLIVSAIVSASIGLWYYGTNVAAVAFTDSMVLSLLGISFFGLIFLAIFAGGKLNSSPVLLWAFIGILHAVLQTSVVLFLVINNTWLEILLISSVIIGFSYQMPYFFQVKEGHSFSRKAQKKHAWRLLTGWALFASVLLLVIIVISLDRAPMEVTGWRFVAAAVLGAVFSCVWFGWYLAVSLAFNGHNNEAGGGARLPRYRQFIRFKITEKQLTGYVIGIDAPQDKLLSQRENTGRQNVHVVDVFSLHAQ